MDHPFKIGEEYRNRNGHYEVLAINDPKMRIRYEDSSEVVVTIAIQARIWESMQLEAAQPKAKTVPHKSYRKTGTTRSRKQVGKASKTDEREKLIAQILENDKAIFELLTRTTTPPGPINT
jgi:hypothetical protein